MGWCSALLCSALLCSALLFHQLRGPSQSPSIVSQSVEDASLTGLLDVSASRVSLGVISRSERASGTLNVLNAGQAAVAVQRVETSCPCVTVVPSQFELRASERLSLTINFDPADETDFTGGLSVRVTAFSGGGLIAFQIVVELEVRSQSETQNQKQPAHSVSQLNDAAVDLAKFPRWRASSQSIWV